MFRTCSALKNVDIKDWNTNNMLSMIVVKNADYIKYAKENNLDYLFQSVIGDVIIMASKASHPKLFDGSLD